MNADAILASLRRHGFGLISGVPCSYLTPLINGAIDSRDIRYVNAANEGEAVAICSGAELGGVRSVAMFQNSGLGNAVSPLTSLNAIFEIPLLLIVTWRGRPGGEADEPQHELMGRISQRFIETMEIPHEEFPTDEKSWESTLQRATASMDSTGRPFALIMPKGAIEPRKLNATPPPRQVRDRSANLVTPRQLNVDDCLVEIGEHAADQRAALLATTGFTGRALYSTGDRENQFYMVGSMGCVSSLALGIAIARPERKVIAIDGDGAFLMRMGSVAAVAAESPGNLTHIVFDNGVHDSTGAQATVSHVADIPAIASACGYQVVETVDTLDRLRSVLRQDSDTLRMIYVRTLPRDDRKLPRPTITPPQVAQRMRNWLTGTPRR
jgi:phosphonopyruvate decarboxylase